MKKFGMFVLAAVTVVSAIYLFRHLVRWEWHRAMFAGVVMLAGEIALAGIVVLRGVRRVLAEASTHADVDDRVLERLRQARPPSSRVFAWLQPDGNQLNVFVSILLGGGVLISAAAWVIDKLAKATSSGGLESRLAMRLMRLRLPDGGFVVPDDILITTGRSDQDDAVRLLLGPAQPEPS